MIIMLAFGARPSLAACGVDADEVDVRCYNGDLQAALREALGSDRPVLLPHGTYSINQPLVYAAQADTGFLIISQGAIIDATAIHNGPTVEIICSGGSPAKSKGCFYFHQKAVTSLYGGYNVEPDVGRRVKSAGSQWTGITMAP